MVRSGGIAQFAGGSEADIFKGIARLYSHIATDLEGAKTDSDKLTGFYRKAGGAK